MPRITVNVSEKTKEWLDAESERLNWSLADTGGRCIEAHHSDVAHINPNESDVKYSNSMQNESTSAIESRLDDLEQRLSELESRDGNPDPTAREHDARDVTQRADGDGGGLTDGPSVASNRKTSGADVSGSESTEDFGELLSGVYDDMEHQPARREAGRAALQWLREQDGHRSGQDFKDALYDEWQVANENADTWWRKTAREALSVAVEEGLVEYREGYHDYKF